MGTLQLTAWMGSRDAILALILEAQQYFQVWCLWLETTLCNNRIRIQHTERMNQMYASCRPTGRKQHPCASASCSHGTSHDAQTQQSERTPILTTGSMFHPEGWTQARNKPPFASSYKTFACATCLAQGHVCVGFAKTCRATAAVYALALSRQIACRAAKHGAWMQTCHGSLPHRERATQVGSRPIRPLSSLVLPRQQIDMLVADAEKFLGAEEWYGESAAGAADKEILRLRSCLSSAPLR